MFEGTFRLLRMEAKFIWALVTFGFTIGTAMVRGITWLVRRMLRRTAPTQAPAAPSEPLIPTSTRFTAPGTPPSPAPTTAAPVTVNVTVNNNGSPSAPPPASAGPSPGPAHPTPPAPVSTSPRPKVGPAQILANPDHGIYVTTGSAFIEPHPFAAHLLEQLDYMLYRGAHRKGQPWNVPPALDTSEPSQLATPLANIILPDDGMDDVPRQALPDAGDSVWIARSGRPFERQRPHNLREAALLRLTPVPAPAPPPPVIAGIWPDGVDSCPVRAVPPADGAIWVARTSRDFERQLST